MDSVLGDAEGALEGDVDVADNERVVVEHHVRVVGRMEAPESKVQSEECIIPR